MFEKFLEEESKKDYFVDLMTKLNQEYQEYDVYPPYEKLFACFKAMEEDLKVVIIGQDPYHQKEQANGLAFSVNPGVKIPPSLRNIYKELHSDIGMDIPNHGDLSAWAKQGVLLLNNVLSVRDSQANSHLKLGWQPFVEATLKYIDTLDQPIVFILWGKNAQEKKKWITNKNRLILESVHPSPLSCHRGFFDSKPFSKTNDYLKANDVKEIEWEAILNVSK